MKTKQKRHQDPQIEAWIMEGESGASYELSVFTPNQSAPPSGYPVLYVLDGNAFFQMVADAIKLQSRRPDATGVSPAVVVGIGYPGGEPFNRDRRFIDYTPPAETTELPPMPNGNSWPENGGANQFLSFIKEEVQPFVIDRFEINPDEQTIFGHSLGGLFALYTLFNDPSTFSGYIATSPSIWWNQQAVLEQETPFLHKLDTHQEPIRLFLSVGSLEKAHMVTDADALAERLETHNCSTFTSAYVKGEEENHMSIVPTILSKSLRFVLGA
ncbi:alpha/beta hydrolase [Pontibacillus sp. ALD_SL1]|uniref:alpha/beta hydrolase n=1 Tax=Pontibacillus sp. ALD_SL1 TaxID=2777185 RepID=UPI001A96895F|nr:alpha/beta hydrolase-fold protein [Pontibacillus sp. ALD_SL1]QST01035.1 alpha/beta hydrolase [Pontibacillus sp. ALD_SL1]